MLFTSSSPLGGTFTFSSYRDPRQSETLAAFDAAATWAARKGAITPRHLEEAQLQCFKALDAPTAPNSRGSRRFAHPQLSDEARQAFRARLLDACAADLCAVSERYLCGVSVPKSECIVGNAAAVGVNEADGWALLGPELLPLDP